MLTFDHCRRLTYIGLVPLSFALLKLPLKNAMLAISLVLLALGAIGIIIYSARYFRSLKS